MKNRRLTFKFTLMFAAFTFVTLVVSSFFSYITQNKIYKTQRDESIHYIADYLEKRFSADKDIFPNMLDYLVTHFKEFKVPEDFTEKDVEAGKLEFARLFAERHPGKVLGEDILFTELDDELKQIYTIAYLEFYTIMLEDAVK